MIKQSLTIINKLGLHARAAAKLAGVSGRFSSEIKINTGTKEADCKSVMSLMLLAASKGTDISITAQGEDQQEALDAVIALINNRFDEEE